VQTDVNAGARPGSASEAHSEVKRLKAEVKKLQGNEILKAATVLFAGDLDLRIPVIREIVCGCFPGLHPATC